MKIFILLVLLLSGCNSLPVKAPSIVGKYNNACLPEAIEMSSSLQKSDIISQVVIFKTDQRQHAICVYMYPPGKNKIWGWDSYYGSHQLKAWWNDPVSESKSWLFYNGGTYEQFISAETVN